MADKTRKYQPEHGQVGFRGGDRQTQATAVVLRAWKGMLSNASPHVLGVEYVQIQENAQSVVGGQLWGRAGMREVQFEA